MNFYLFLVLVSSNTYGQFYTLYNPEPSTENYYISPLTLPAYDVTVCFWWKPTGEGQEGPTMISIASEGMN